MKLRQKFSLLNKVPASKLKKKTACAVCGDIEHWKGDPQCKVSGATAASSTTASSPSTAPKKGGKGDKPHQTFTVMRSDLGNYEVRSAYGAAFAEHQPGG